MNSNVEVYLDASVLVALLTNDPLTGRADAFMRTKMPVLVVSDFAAVEFASAIARRYGWERSRPMRGASGFQRSTRGRRAPRGASRPKRQTYRQRRHFCGGSTSICAPPPRSISQ